ncbi:hypothetical protein EDB85DRAFT_1892600 [Lactarius pseudohatsudake]|nr:hypothetical protein EDB85DRAFT_1892600 [Lactarius pseudohatsudake]
MGSRTRPTELRPSNARAGAKGIQAQLTPLQLERWPMVIRGRRRRGRLSVRGGVAERKKRSVLRSGHIGTNARLKRSSEPTHKVNQTEGSEGVEEQPYDKRRVKRRSKRIPPQSQPDNEWRLGFVILAANVDAIPTPPPRSGVVIGVTVSGGLTSGRYTHSLIAPNFPYLAWIPLHLSGPSVLSGVLTHSVDKSMWQVLPGNSNIHVINPDVLDKLTVEWTTLKAALQDPFSDMGFEALSRLKQDFGAWRDFVEVFRNLQRSLLELHAFLDWWKDISTGDYFRSPVRAPTRGAIFEDVHHYMNYPLLHSLHHWYYPPLVCDVVTALETAARGYAERLDSFNLTKEVKPGRRAKRAKADTDTLLINNPELRRLTDAGAVPNWFPGIQDIWTHAMGSHQPSRPRFAKVSSPLRASSSPPLLGWNRPERDLPGLTTQEWRSILGNTYWKKQWPRHDGNNLLAFDPNVFLEVWGLLLFGDVQSADITAGCYNPTSLLSCCCDVQLATADDTDIRQVYEEIREIKRLQFPTTFEKRWRSQYLELNQILEMWDPSGGCSVNPKFFRKKKVWRSWVQAVRDLVVDWDGFEQWDWGGFSKVRMMEINNLSGSDLHKFTIRLLTFFIHSFVTRLGYYPSPLLLPPTLAAHSCADHTKSFGNAHFTLPISVEYLKP